MIPKVTPFDAYKSYLGLKNHFTKPKYDYHKYCGKSRASLQSFYKNGEIGSSLRNSVGKKMMQK